MEYILYQEVKFQFPPNRTANRMLTHLDSFQNDIIAATTNIGEVYVFSTTSYSFINSFQACSRGANIILFIDKNNMITGGGDGTIKHFQYNIKLDTFQLIREIQLKSSINTLQRLSSNIIITTDIQSNVYQIDVTSFKYNLLFQSSFNPIHSIKFGAFNHIFATLTSNEGILTIWDLSTYLSLGEIKYAGNGKKGTALLFHCQNKILTGFDNGAIVCYNIGRNQSLTVEWEIKSAHRGKVNCLSIVDNTRKNRQLLLSGGDDGLLNIWNYSTKQLISQFHAMIESIQEIVVDTKYKEYLIHLLGSNGQIGTFSLKREDMILRRMIPRNKHNFGRLTDLIQSQNDEFELISSTSNGFLLIWDQELVDLIDIIDCKELIKDRDNNNLCILSIAISNNSKYVCFGDNIGSIYIISIIKKELITSYNIHSGGITSIEWTPDDKQIITASIDSSIAVSNFYT